MGGEKREKEKKEKTVNKDLTIVHLLVLFYNAGVHWLIENFHVRVLFVFLIVVVTKHSGHGELLFGSATRAIGLLSHQDSRKNVTGRRHELCLAGLLMNESLAILEH